MALCSVLPRNVASALALLPVLTRQRKMATKKTRTAVTVPQILQKLLRVVKGCLSDIPCTFILKNEARKERGRKIIVTADKISMALPCESALITRSFCSIERSRDIRSNEEVKSV